MGSYQNPIQAQKPSTARSATLTPRTDTFAAEVGDGSKRPDEMLETSWLDNLLGGIDDAKADAGLVDHNVSLDDLTEEQREQIANIEDGSMLHLTFENEEMEGINAASEIERMAEEEGVFSVHNADPEMIQYLLQSNKFTDMSISAHGNEEGIYGTAANGDAELITAESLAEMAKGTSLEEVLVASCNSGDSVAEAMQGVGVSSMTFGNEVKNVEATDALFDFAADRDLQSVQTDQDVMEGMRENLVGSDQRFVNMYGNATGNSRFTEGEAPAASGTSPEVS